MYTFFELLNSEQQYNFIVFKSNIEKVNKISI